MKFSKIKLFGFLALSCSLIACGQTQALTAPNVTSGATPNAIAQTSTATNTSSPEAKVKNGKVCGQVIANVKDVLGTIPDVEVTSESKFSNLSVPYPDPSANLNRRYAFVIKGNGIYDVWKAEKVMIEITQQIIDNCDGAAAVTFARWGSGESYTFGLFPDGSIKLFTCVESRARSRPPAPSLTWGQSECNL